MYAAQRTLLEAWSIIEQHFVDQGSLSNWDQVLGDSLTAAYTSTSGDVAYHEIEAMIKKLNDPYTRIIPPRYLAKFTWRGLARCRSNLHLTCTRLSPG